MRRAALIAGALWVAAIPARGQGLPDAPCPDASDVVVTFQHYVELATEAHRADTLRLPQDCLFTGGARFRAMPDSTMERLLTLLDAVLTHRNVSINVLDARLRLLFRGARYDAVAPAFERLVKIDSTEATLANYRIVVAAQQRRADTTSLKRYLDAAVRRYPGDGLLADEARVMATVPQQRALIPQLRKAPPSRTEVYPTLISIYGNLGETDSVVSVLKVALKRNIPATQLAPSLHSAVAALIRRAQLQNAADIWSLTAMRALAIDSTLSTGETQYLVALAVTEDLGNEIAMLPLRQPTVPVNLAPAVCPHIPEMLALVVRAQDRIEATGATYGESATRIRAQLKTLRDEWIDPINAICLARRA